MPLSYYLPISSRDMTYSVDMVVLKGSFHPRVKVESFWPNEWVELDFLRAFRGLLLRLDESINYKFFESFNFLTYRNMFVIQLPNGGVARFFLGFQGYKGDEASRWKIEFNPNKCLPNDDLLELIRFVWFHSSSPYFSSFDLAVDIPCKRSDCFMLKDKRKYQLVMNSLEDKTEYLGTRHAMGFCKLYNKSIESGLDYDLTRFEITVVLKGETELFSLSDLRSYLPIVYYMPAQQMTFADYEMNGTDRLLLAHVLEYPHDLSGLPHEKRKKISTLLQQRVRQLEFDEVIVLKLYEQIRELLR